VSSEIGYILATSDLTNISDPGIPLTSTLYVANLNVWSCCDVQFEVVGSRIRSNPESSKDEVLVEVRIRYQVREKLSRLLEENLLGYNVCYVLLLHATVNNPISSNSKIRSPSICVHVSKQNLKQPLYPVVVVRYSTQQMGTVP